MSTDESYLDSLLNGLSSDKNSSTESRLSSYKKNKVEPEKEPEDVVPEPITEEPISEPKTEPVGPEPIPAYIDPMFNTDDSAEDTVQADQDDIPDFLDEFFPDPEDKQSAFDEKTSEPGFDFETDDGNVFEDPVAEAGAIENYNIFEDYDDAAIDKMINDELSGSEPSGEQFVVPENNSFDFLSGVDFDDESTKDVELSLADQIAEIEENDPDAIGFFGEEHENNVFGDAADPTDPAGNLNGPADLFSFGSEEEEKPSEYDNIVSDNGDTYGFPEELLSNGSYDVAGDMPEDRENFREPQEDNPLEGFVFDAEDAADTGDGQDGIDDDGLSFLESGDLEQIGDENGFMGSLGMDSLNDDDIAALDNLFSEINIPDDDVVEKKVKKQSAPKEKTPWYIKLFGNISLPEDKIKAQPTEEEIAAQKAAAKEASKALKENKKAEKEARKKAAEDEKAAKARQSAEEKELARKKKLEQANRMILDDVGFTARLNPWGIGVIFALFAAIVILIISGGRTLDYNTRIREASKLFDNALVYRDRTYYSEAYDRIYSLDIEKDDEDYLLWDKVVTINIVNVQLSMYNTHVAMGQNVTGLEDLLRGMRMVRKYKKHAAELGAQNDMDFVRSIILKELWETYRIDEEETANILDTYDAYVMDGDTYAADLAVTRFIWQKAEELNIKNVDLYASE